jgi:FtsP/CotA-like multicopper oxidase with cupredoxin domain
MHKRRTFLKAAIAATAAPLTLTSRKSGAQTPPVLPPSPPTTPWVEELPTAITPLAPVSALTPAPQGGPNTTAGEAGRAPHQRWDEFSGSPDLELYELTAKENPNWVFNPAYPTQSIWGYVEGHTPEAIVTTPGPTFFAHYDRPIICRIHNGLPQGHVGFGTPEISTHLHNLHMASESDGFPGDYYSPTQAGPTLTAPGAFKDHLYPNILAGGDPNEALGTLFYHDHVLDFTAPNLYRGLFGFYLLFDDLDSGSENTGLRLPSHPYDYTLDFSDKRFDAGGMLYFDELNPEGVLGDKVAVNGKIEPVLRVARRKYRLRLLNTGPTRFYEFYLANKSNNTVYTFTYIANDGNLLPTALKNQFKVRLGVAERADIVVDFKNFPLGTELYLVNRLLQTNTRGPGNVQAPGTKVLKFIVDRNATDAPVVPNLLRPLPALPTPAEIAALQVRRWEFDRASGMWAVNSEFFDVFNRNAIIPKGSVEIWEFVNLDNGWQHPIHVHFEEGRILSKIVNGVNIPVPAHEKGRKDVFVLGEDMTMRVLLHFRDFTGKYVMHCHNLTHEDHAMMVRFDIV